MFAWRDSPGPFTTQPMTATRISSTPGWSAFQWGILSRKCRFTVSASSWKYVLVVRPHPGQDVTCGWKCRMSNDCKIC